MRTPMVLLSLLLFTCSESESEFCVGNDDRICPVGSTCTISGDGCTTTRCGNQIVDKDDDELCDDGNLRDGDGCRADCKSTERCGDGVVDERLNEECDNGGKDDAECDHDCTFVHCGDGLVNKAAGEACDEGESRPESCSHEAAGEDCEPVPEACCDSHCQLGVSRDQHECIGAETL